MHFDLPLAFLTAYVFGLSLYPVFIKIYSQNNLVDKRDVRKVHLVEVPTMGGVPIFIAFLVSIFIWLSFSELEDQRYFIGALIFIFFLGLRDDFVNLKPITKLFSQIVPALVMFYLANIKIVSLYGFISTAPFSIHLSLLLTIFTIIVITNSFNLIDGLDGLAGVVSLIVLTAFGIWFIVNNHHSNGILMFAMAGSVFAFIQYNWQPARIFMGDTGALLLGFFFSITTIQFLNLNSSLSISSPFRFEGSIATAISILIIPLFDTLRVFTIRIIKRKSPFSPDKNHTHHVLMRLGLTHAQTAIVLGIVNLAFIGLAIVFRHVGDNILIPIILFITIIISLLLDYLIIKQVVSKRGKTPYSLIEVIKSNRKVS